MDVLPQVSNQIINLPLEYITGMHGELVFRWEIQGEGSFVVFLCKLLYYTS